jgi:DNA-binding transcriptional LysR family regulator
MDRLDAMRVFVAVAEAGSFAAAARRLRLSPTAVTRAVAALEDHLGLMLLARTTRSVRLTERGGAYLENCRRLLAGLDDAERQARGDLAEPRGRLTVAAPLVFGRLHVLPVAQALMQRHPALSIRLALSDRPVSLGEEGVDVAVRIGELADSALVARRVTQVQRVLVASPAYLAARGVPADPAALETHDLITFEGLDAAPDWRFGPETGQGAGAVVRVRPRLSVNSADAALAAVEAGAGITRALSYQVLAGLEAGRLALVLQPLAPPPIPVSLLHLPIRLGSANVEAFMTLAAERLRALRLLP